MKKYKHSNLYQKIQEMFKQKPSIHKDTGGILIELFYDDLHYSKRKRSKFSKNNKRDFAKYLKGFNIQGGGDYAFALDCVIDYSGLTPQFLFGLLRQIQGLHQNGQTFKDDFLHSQHSMQIYPLSKQFIKRTIHKLALNEYQIHLLKMICCEEMNFDITKTDSELLDLVFDEGYHYQFGGDYLNIIQKCISSSHLDLDLFFKKLKKAQRLHKQNRSLTKKSINY